MKCECLKKLKERIKEQLNGKAGEIEPDTVMVVNSGKMIELTRTVFTYELLRPKGRKKKDTISVIHSYCPFCGTPTEYKKQE